MGKPGYSEGLQGSICQELGKDTSYQNRKSCEVTEFTRFTKLGGIAFIWTSQVMFRIKKYLFLHYSVLEQG